jgi:hypothetical protein
LNTSKRNPFMVADLAGQRIAVARDPSVHNPTHRPIAHYRWKSVQAYYKRESIAEMENIEVVELLREIRDLQNLRLEKYEEFSRNQQIALQQQRESMAAVRKKASRLARSALLSIGILALGLIVPHFCASAGLSIV